MKKLFDYTFFDSEKELVRLIIGSENPVQLKVASDGKYARAVAHLTKNQAKGLAYRLLNAANQGDLRDDERNANNDDVSPEGT